MGPARIYPGRRMHRSRAPSIALGTLFVAQSWAGCITNMPGFDLRQAQHTGLESLWSMPKPLETSAKLHGVSVSREILSIERLDKKTEMTSRYEHFQYVLLQNHNSSAP